MRNKKLTKILSLIALILVLLISISIYWLLKPVEITIDSTAIEDNNGIVEVEEAIEETSLFTKEQYSEFENINSDYIGQIIFESEIINEPVLYSSVNSYYLRKNINKEYSIQGSVYLDERNNLSDQNIILYGHFTEPGFTDYEGYDPNIRPMFTNLDLLLDKDNYEDNKTVYLYLEDEVRKYEVVSVYYCPLFLDEDNVYSYVTEGYEYYQTEYSPEEFKKYNSTITTHEQYKTDAGYGYADKFLTLQTCVAARPDLREIVLCKEIGRNKYN